MFPETNLKVFKATHSIYGTKAYLFHWQDISPGLCYVYFISDPAAGHNYWADCPRPFREKDIAGIWEESTLLEVLVVTGLSEASAIKSILDRTEDGWVKLSQLLDKVGVHGRSTA